MIGALLRLPWEAVRERMLDGLHASGFTDLVPAHLTVLQYPGPDNRRPSDLAAETRMTKQAMNYLLGQMERHGYLVRADDPEDQRSKRIHLTDRGHAAFEKMREIVARTEAEWKQELGAEQFAQLQRLLVQLNTTVHPPDGASHA